MAAGGRRDFERVDVLVLGAGMAGLLCAAAAAGAGREVLILERDRLSPDTAGRKGVPQGTQAHVYLRRGLSATQELLPGLTEDLLAQGGVPVDTGRLAWLGEHGWSPVGDHGFDIVSLTRPVLERTVRSRVLATAGVRLRSGVRAQGLSRAGRRWRVALAGSGDQLVADLVVDATGRGSRMPQWLTDLGLPAVRTSVVDARVGYATRLHRGTGGGAGGIVVVATPQHPRGGIALPVEDGCWLVGLVGFGDDRPERGDAAYRAFAASLRDPAIADLIARCTPVGDVAVYRQTGNVRRHYEQVKGWPEGLLVVGDAACAFNPVYGQGITVAALQAVQLRAALASRRSALDTGRLQRRVVRAADLPWSIAVGEDLRYPSSLGSQSQAQALLGAWARQVALLGVCGDLRATATLGRVYQLVGSPLELFHPGLLLAAGRARLRGYGPRTPRPEELIAAAARPTPTGP